MGRAGPLPDPFRTAHPSPLSRRSGDGPLLRLTDNATDSLIPAIKPAGERFALVWNEYTPARQDTREPEDGRSELAFALVP